MCVESALSIREVGVLRALPGALRHHQLGALVGLQFGVAAGQVEIVGREVVRVQVVAEQRDGAFDGVVARPGGERDGHAGVVGNVGDGQIAELDRVAHQGQVDEVVADVEVCDRVVAGAVPEHERVIALATGERIVSGTADDGVIAGPAGDGVVALVAQEQVVAFAAVDAVIAGVAPDNVGAAAAENGVVAGAATDAIPSPPGVNRIVARAAEDVVEVVAARDRVVASGSVEPVEPAGTLQGVVGVGHRPAVSVPVTRSGAALSKRRVRP